MPTTDPRVDAYIAQAAPFAQPILAHLRKLVHAACPDVQEAIKWGMPHFLYRDRILCGMAAFKQHATFGFRHAAELFEPPGAECLDGPALARRQGSAGEIEERLELEPSPASTEAMGQFGRIQSVADLPAAAILKKLVREAMRLTESGVKASLTAPKPRKPPLRAPADLTRALAANVDAKRHFDAFPPGQRREYIEWLTEAKRPETREKRLAQTIEWLAEGKRRHWKYERC